ncbi:MAG: sugar ABC transporter ATP-binding protein [Planctomycetes bacterium]|nr:sugar ABC transporter ATP-binding protein [Planctomycetota bacterium]
MPLLQMRSICKSFPGVRALEHVDLRLEKGEILGLIGENGAGKSTLLKILGGVHRPDSGAIEIDGREVQFHEVQDAMALGISLIHQELNLASNLDVAANVFLGREPARFSWIDRRRLYREAERLCRSLDFDVPLRTSVDELSPGKKQMVEIAKALSLNVRILIMDEPTSSLSEAETERLFQVVEQLRVSGVSIIYVTHRLWELKRIADRVEVMRDGKNAGSLAKNEIEHDRMVQLMVGRNIESYYTPHDRVNGKAALEVSGLRYAGGGEEPISFKVHQGEIVGLAGLVGAGRSELAQALFGLRPVLSGSVAVGGRPVPRLSPKLLLRAGLGLVPEDRKLQGLVLQMPVEENIALAGLAFFNWKGWVDFSWKRKVAADMISHLRIRTPRPSQIAKLLSGGNQQKVVMAKWLALKLKVLIIDEPTRGIDVGAKAEIYQLMKDLTARGLGILMISSELEELIHTADRILVMHEASLAGELSREEISEEAIMQLATGRKKSQGAA